MNEGNLHTESLSALSNSELIEKLSALARREAAATLDVLLHLAELEERKLHLKLGFSSLFAYCTERLKYSEGAANRRIKAARCIRKHPEALELLRERRLSLSTICILFPVLTRENKAELLSQAADKNQAEVERIAAGRRTEVTLPRDSVRAVRVAAPALAPTPLSAGGALGGEPPRGAGQEAPRPMILEVRAKSAADGEEAARIKLRYSFLAGEEFGERVKRMRALMSNRYPRGASLEEVFGEALEYYLRGHEPKEKRRAGGARMVPVESHTESRARYISAAVRAEVYRRDGGACSYVGLEGKRCGSRWGLEYDHIVPHGMGGTSAAGNVRLLCAKHNRLDAERVYGEGSMAARISAGRQAVHCAG